MGMSRRELPGRKRNKYGVSPAHERRWNGRTYDSKAEMRYAQLLSRHLQEGSLVEVIEQPLVRLGVPENTYRPDFLVIPPPAHTPYFVDVKGHETAQFKRIKKLWASYGRLNLVIEKAPGNRFKDTTEVIEGGAAK